MRPLVIGLAALLLGCSRTPPEVPTTLVLHDEGELGELYAAGAGVVLTRFGSSQTHPVTAYRSGEMRGYSAVVYIGSTPDAAVPDAFRRDVAAGLARTVWLGANLDAASGITPGPVDPGPFRTVTYKGVPLARVADVGLHTVAEIDSHARVLALARREDGTSTPWAVRSGRLTYVAENPLAWVTTGDRFLAFADLLFDDLAPATEERHRALVRLEDVSPNTSAASLRAAVDVLAARHAPFAIALVPVWVDPRVGQTLRLRDEPELVAALRDACARGGTLVLHGYTHQRSGVTGEDIEFVHEDGESFAEERVAKALEEVAAAGLPRPWFFEFPHYVGSPAAAKAIARHVPNAFQRETIFAPGSTQTWLSLTLPFAVDDPYGFRVVPENLGYYEPDAPLAIAQHARAVRVVRDSVAGFFFHPTFEAATLARIVDQLRSDGWELVAADTVAQRKR